MFFFGCTRTPSPFPSWGNFWPVLLCYLLLLPLLKQRRGGTRLLILCFTFVLADLFRLAKSAARPPPNFYRTPPSFICWFFFHEEICWVMCGKFLGKIMLSIGAQWWNTIFLDLCWIVQNLVNSLQIRWGINNEQWQIQKRLQYLVH